jgi:hypothetical protein
VGKHERQVSSYWVAIESVTLPVNQWRYVVTDCDPSRLDSVRAERPFTYQAVHEELMRIGFRRELIPPESYFSPTADEREERAEIIFREVPARTGFRK